MLTNVTSPFILLLYGSSEDMKPLLSFLLQLISSVGERRGAPEKKKNRELRIKRKNSDDLLKSKQP